MQNIHTPLTLESFDSLCNSEIPVLVDFHASWCEPCRYLDKILDELNPQIVGNASIIKLDVDQQADLTRHFEIRSVPTLMIFKKGALRWRMPGFMLAHELKEKLESFYTD